jgi:hypothetical protein
MKEFKTQDELLQMFKIGMEFELYSKLKEKDLVKSLSEYIGKKIIVAYEITGFNKKSLGVHNHNITPTATEFKLEKDYSGGESMWELITGPMEYAEARIIMIKVHQWLQKYGWTTDRCSNHINISINKMKNPLSSDILTMDRLKFCLSFDEKLVYQKFPMRQDNVYAQSMKQIYPNNKFAFDDNVKLISLNSYKTPSTKYYGVNFIKQQNNYLEFRYIGGADYEKKTNSILELVDHFCLSIYNTIKNPDYSQDDINQLNSILKKQKTIVKRFSTLDDFMLSFPDIKLMVDLNGHYEVIKSRWHELKDKLYELIIYCKMDRGYLNYDPEAGKYQVKNAILKDCNNIYDWEIINCEADGLFYNCDFYYCTINNSQIHDSDLIKGNNVENSKIINTPIKYNNRIFNCYIDNKNTLINGKIEQSIIRNGDLSQMAVIDDKTLIVDKK